MGFNPQTLESRGGSAWCRTARWKSESCVSADRHGDGETGATVFWHKKGDDDRMIQNDMLIYVTYIYNYIYIIIYIYTHIITYIYIYIHMCKERMGSVHRSISSKVWSYLIWSGFVSFGRISSICTIYLLYLTYLYLSNLIYSLHPLDLQPSAENAKVCPVEKLSDVGGDGNKCHQYISVGGRLRYTEIVSPEILRLLHMIQTIYQT